MTPLLIEIKTADERVLRGQVWPDETLSIVLLHDVGENEDLDRWRPLIPYLLAEHVTVFAVDLRGHGASDGEWSAETSADDIATVVRAVRDRSDGPVLIVAAGQSAVDALSAAEQEPFNGVVALSATGPLTPQPATQRVPGPRIPGRSGSTPHSEATPPPPRLGEGSGERAISQPQQAPRAPGTPKLFLVGAQDLESRQTTAQLHAASIGWALVVTLPTSDRGTDLLTGSVATHAREQILGFTRECRFLARSGTKSAPSPGAAEAFLQRLGIKVKGAET